MRLPSGVQMNPAKQTVLGEFQGGDKDVRQMNIHIGLTMHP